MQATKAAAIFFDFKQHGVWNALLAVTWLVLTVVFVRQHNAMMAAFAGWAFGCRGERAFGNRLPSR